MEIFKEYIIAIISIASCLLGFWMGRKTQGKETVKLPSLKTSIHKAAIGEPEGDMFADALGSPDQDIERIPTVKEP
jgi:hypothetical protein